MIEIDKFLTEAADEPPYGPDLTYDAEFLALETAATGKPEQQFGDTVIPAEPPDWRDVEKRAVALLERTKDLRVAAYLTRAWVNFRGLPGLAGGTELVAGLLDRYWDGAHPLPEDGDYFMRMNAIASLADLTGLVRDLRGADFLKASYGSISVRDADSLARGNPPEAGSMSLEQLRLAVADGVRKGSDSLKAVDIAREAVRRIRSLCSDKVPSDQLPELNNLEALLNALHGLLPSGGADTALAGAIEAMDGEAQAAAEGAGVPAGVAVGLPAGPARLRTREDAIAQLLAVAEFLEQTEPTNPAPLLVRRAARLMRMGFMDILRELSPDSVSQVETITGRTADAEY